MPDGAPTSDVALVAAAAAGSHDAFRALLEPIERDLHLLCYRMMGSLHDAQDVLQEAKIRAWKALPGYRGRASFGTWMYRVATNASLDALRSRRRRFLPQDLGSARDPELGLGHQRDDIPWLEPYPDSLLPSEDPHTALELRESVRLAFIELLQLLPPRQRAVLILRDVLDWSGAEVAAALSTSIAAVNSALQRARATLGGRRRGEPRSSVSTNLSTARAAMADRYVRAWEAGDIDAIVDMLAEEATHAMPPWPAWFVGRETLKTVYAAYPIWHGQPRPGLFRIVPVPLNGELGFAEYCRDGPSDPFRALALTIAVLSDDGSSIAEKISFVDAGLFPLMGLPGTLD